MNWETILFIGDSITNGARSYLSFPEYTGNFLEESTGKSWNIINVSKNGLTVNELNKLVSSSYSSLKAADASLVVILIGTNDAKEITEVNDLRIAYNQLLIKAKLLAQNKTVLVIKIPPFQKGVMLPYNFGMNKTVNEYNITIDELVLKHNVDCIATECVETDFYDGVHLNKEGARRIGKQIAGFILTKRGI
jgi:lysophospholipase L1-like esterase